MRAAHRAGVAAQLTHVLDTFEQPAADPVGHGLHREAHQVLLTGEVVAQRADVELSLVGHGSQ